MKRAGIGIVLAFAAASSGARADDEPDEVSVVGQRREVGGASMRREEAREVPGSFGDPARFVESMPGVVPTSSGLAAYFIRGAPPETTGYFIDGIPVPALYHIGFGPTVVHPALIDRVEFFPGAPPAYFGRDVGGVIAGETTAPAKRAHGEGSLRLFDVSGLAEAPIADGRGTVLASARYAYPGPVVSLFTSDVSLAYWDYQARATYDLGDRDRVTAFVFGSYDHLTSTDTNGAGVKYTHQIVDTEFHRVDLRYDRAIGAATTLRVAATLGTDKVGGPTSSVVDQSARIRTEVDSRASRTVRVRFGADASLSHYAAGASPIDPGDPDRGTSGDDVVPRDDLALGIRGDVAWRVAPRVEIVPGMRGDLFASKRNDGSGATAKPTLDPRLATRVTVTSGVAWLSTIGLSHQVPGLVVSSPTDAPFLNASATEEGLQSSIQMSQGVEVALPEAISASATGFLHDYDGLPDLTAPCLATGAADRCIEQRVKGRAYGLELLVKRSLTERLAFWVSYTLSRSVREANGFLPGRLSWIPSEYDRTHVVSVIGAYDLGRRWRIGSRAFAYSGRPYSPTYEGIPVQPYNTARLPGFYRIDARLEKSWTLGQSGRISFIVEGLNVTLRKEADDATCPTPVAPSLDALRGHLPPGASYDHCTVNRVGPITIPSVGVEATF